MEMVAVYLFKQSVPYREPLPFPQYLDPSNRYKNDFWITQEGECVYPWEMNDSHLLNVMRLVHNRHTHLLDMYMQIDADDLILKGPIKVPTGKQKRTRKPSLIEGMERTRVLGYNRLWEEYRLYMLLRREIRIRRLEEYL